MEEQNTSKNLNSDPESNSEQVVNQIPVPHQEHHKKNLILEILIVVLLLAVFSGAFYYLGANKNQASVSKNENIQQNMTSPEPDQTSSSKLKSLVPITKNTISYGYQGDNLLMHYRNKVYSYDSVKMSMNEPEPESEYPNITWYGLLQAPETINEAISKNDSAYDEILNFTPLPIDNFVFVMRWDHIIADNKANWDLPIYYFDSSRQALEKLAENTWPNDKENPVPFFNSISPDNKNIAFNMYECWNCGAGYPQIALINIATKTKKNLGQIVEFKWTGNKTYSYKEYKETDCSGPQPGPCLEDSKNLPLKTGSF